MITLSGEMGYPGVLSAPVWGFEDVLFKGEQLSLPQAFGSYVMENVLFKISFPAEFHAQTAVEAAVALHSKIKDKLDDIKLLRLQLMNLLLELSLKLVSLIIQQTEITVFNTWLQ